MRTHQRYARVTAFLIMAALAVPAGANACDNRLPALTPEYAKLILEVGTAAERQQLRQCLMAGTVEPAILNDLIAHYLGQHEYDAAAYWLTRTQFNGAIVPVWQRLSLALAEDDLQTAQTLFHEFNDEIAPATRVELLQRLHRFEDALILAQRHLDTVIIGDETDELTRQADILAMTRARRLRVHTASRDVGVLTIASAGATVDFAVNDTHRIALQFSGHRLDSIDRDDLSVDNFDQEEELSLSAVRTQASTRLTLRLGGNRRNDTSIVYGSLAWQWRLDPSMHATAKLAVNQLTDATAVLRAAGTKSYISAAITATPNRWNALHLDLQGHRYQTRRNDTLATGITARGTLSHVLTHHLPRWDISLRGVWEKNTLENDAPKHVARSINADVTDIDAIISSDHRFVGIGTTLRHGNDHVEPGRPLNAFIDLYAGWLWPDSQASYGTQMSLSTSLSPRNRLTLEAAYANALNGVSSQDSRKIGLSYRHRF